MFSFFLAFNFPLATLLSPLGTLAQDPRDATVLRLEKMPAFFSGLNIFNTEEPCGGLNGLCVPRGYYQRHQWGKIPVFCVENATKPLVNETTYCSPYDVEVYNVSYDDCPDHPVTMCRCQNASVSISQMHHDFGKVPVRARQWIRAVKAIPDQSCNGHICINGPCLSSTSVYLHEVGHSLDVVLGSQGRCVSDTDEWRDAVLNNDTCVPDGYSEASWHENFAQNTVIAAYHHTVRNIWDAYPGNASTGISCMKGALQKTIDLTREIFVYKKGMSCDRTWTGPVTFVCMGPEARKQGLCEGVEDSNIDWAKVTGTPV
ncbi:hypothetical protein QBC42DRAFT_178485 [Cladorrhinum samala]|uniref:Peptidase M12A domain-containing protein n=1 Tax=Cladorrhinum samala TaxID=585594 RepID=A0AAV9HLH8_9PEZI|nr:hypothetical protein QBC42DRAFT_178485 [Cladorrhinum samala]